MSGPKISEFLGWATMSQALFGITIGYFADWFYVMNVFTVLMVTVGKEKKKGDFVDFHADGSSFWPGDGPERESAIPLGNDVRH